MAREFPIANGKLVTDLDANGFKILNTQGGGGSGGTTDYNDLDNKPKIGDVEVSGSKSAEDYGLATKEQLNAVGNIAQGAADGASTAIGEVDKLQGIVEQKRDSTDNIAAKDEVRFTEWKFHCDVPEILEAVETNVRLVYSEADTSWIWENIVPVEGYEYLSSTPSDSGGIDAVSVKPQVPFYTKDGVDIQVTATRKKVTTTKSGEPYVTPTGVEALAIPKYEFVDTSITDGVVTVAPYTNAKLVSDGTAFSVVIGGESGYMRDCVLRVECSDTVPTITWGDNFHPRTDAETDFKCEAGKRNVYWITEYAEGEFVVAGWQETTGGNAQ